MCECVANVSFRKLIFFEISFLKNYISICDSTCLCEGWLICWGVWLRVVMMEEIESLVTWRLIVFFVFFLFILLLMLVMVNLKSNSYCINSDVKMLLHEVCIKVLISSFLSCFLFPRWKKKHKKLNCNAKKDHTLTTKHNSNLY